MGSCRAGATGRPLSAPPASSSGHGALILPQFQSGAEPGQVAQPKVGAGCSAPGRGCFLRATDGGGPVLVPSPPFQSPSGAAVPERLLVQVRGCARPRRLPGLVAELLSFRHGVQAGGGPAGLARLGAPVREGRRGAGWRPDPSFCWFCSPPSLHVPNSWGPGAAPHGVREALGKRRSLGLLCPPSGQAVPKCPPSPGSGCWHRWPCRASPVSQGGCGGQSHLHPDLQRGREQQPGGCSQGGGDAATCIGATLVPPGGQGRLGQGVGPVASRWSTRDSSCLWPGSVV